MEDLTKVTVRKMLETDIDAVHEIEVQSITPPWTKQGFADALKNENACFYVAETDGVVGYCGLYFAADEGEITNVAVSSAWRKKGIADQILKAVISDGKDKNLTQIFLEVRQSNISAQKLYEKHGFASVGVRKNFYRDPKEDAIVMMCSLVDEI